MFADLAVTLKSFGFDDGLIKDIQSYLTDSAGDLDKSVPDRVVAGSFGAAPASLGCFSDANKARDHVHKAVIEMVAGLNGYVTGLDVLQSQTAQVTEATEVQLKQLTDSTSCIQGDFSSADGVCSVPTSQDS